MLAFYDFSVSPFSFDFVQFYVCARAAGAKKVIFVPGKRMVDDGRGSKVEFQKCTPEEQEQRLKNIILPLCDEYEVCKTREEASQYWTKDCFPPEYTLGNPVAWHTVGHVVHSGRFSPIAPLKELRDLIGLPENSAVITIRENHIHPERNSNVEAWLEAAPEIEKLGLNPVFIPDFDFPHRDFGRFAALPEAAFDVNYRLAVYDLATLNLGINTGPLALCFYSKRPLLYFKPVNKATYATSADYWRISGIRPETQPAWFTLFQKIIWEPEDDTETILGAVKSWLAVKSITEAAA